LVTQHRMQVTDIEDGLRVLVFDGYEAIQKISKEANEKVNINYINKLDQYEVFVQVDEITFITYLLPGEIEKYEMEVLKHGTSNDKTNTSIWLSRKRRKSIFL